MAGLKELLVLSDESTEINYSVFRAFACASSNTILAVLYRLGYFGNYAELLHIAGEIIEMREAFDHEEEDADGLIAFLLSNHRGNRLNDRNTSATDGRETLSQLRKRPAEEELETGTSRRARSSENDSEADITASPVQRGGGGGQNEEATPEERVTQLCNNEEVTDEAENKEEVVGEERCNPSSEIEDGEEEPEVEEEQQRHEVGDINFNYVDLLTENMRQFRRFSIIGREASFAIRPLSEGSNIYHTLENAFREIHAYALNLCEPGDYVGMTFHSPNLSQGPAGLSFRPARDISYDDIWKLSLRRDNDSSTVPSSSSSTMAPAMTVTRSTEESTEFDGKVANERACTSKKERVAFVFYDFETRQDESLEGTSNVKKHVPTLCVAQQICEACAKENNLSARCRWCGVREFVFRHDPVKEFVDFATRTTKYFKQIICIAHNAKAFDAQFILKYIVENRNNLEPKLILNGTKIVMLTVGHTKFIDSVNYMPMRLSELPKAFGLQDTSDKGIFPHLFNTVENQSYVGPLPDAYYYSPETMKSEERERFLVWHADMRQKNTVFDFQREIIRYCRTDVDILRQACMAFRKIFIDRGNVCPFEECTTIASTCMTVFRKNFLQQNTIGVIPTGGYRKATNHSRKALQWLIWKERELGHSIDHAGRSREYRTIDGTLVDGYYETPDTETPRRHVLQFHGCFWHGCPSCFPMNRDRPLSTSDCKDTIDSRYERTLAISWRLRQRKYFVTEKWECSFDRDMRDSREMREYLENHPMVETPPLDPRDAFFGGRTGNIVTRYEVTGMEKIRYVDVCSLYPYVLKTGAFPIGHPDIYVGEECSALIGRAPNYNFNTIEGLIRCKVLPPRDLFHPVLPYRAQGKLLFALCRSCCETLSQTDCTHNDAKEREFEGTWVSCELRKAVEKGYHVTAVSEIWQYKISQFDHTTRQGGLFAEYINTFLQLKQEARSADGRANARKTTTMLKKDICGSMRKPKRSNLPNTEVVRTPQRFIALLTSAEHEITDILPVNDEIIYVSWRLRQEAVVSSPLTNVVIAAYTTAQARLTLYSYLERLDRRVLYYDTDSCIYVSSGDPNEYEPRSGNFLGDMTDELESYGSGSYIEAFVSGGPKFYAYVVRSPDGRTHEACKVKGITLNYENSREANQSVGPPMSEGYSLQILHLSLILIRFQLAQHTRTLSGHVEDPGSSPSMFTRPKK
ncbi:uncharacterized protein [Polyergus mexicanus]|uniref:uncharacterized protein n=1 Tax=Polyergus mexicanus TaxID=615972 RepID=UPI0038B54E11